MTTQTAPDADRDERVDVRTRIRQQWEAARSWLATWWLRTVEPASYREAWRQSRYDPARVPSGAPWWVPWLWRLSNGTDRMLWFAVTAPLPSRLRPTPRWAPARHVARVALFLMRWAAVRPTRRLGAYLLLAVLLAAVSVG